MARTFNRVSPTHSYLKKLRLMMIAMGMIITTLVVTVAALCWNTETGAPFSPPPVGASIDPRANDQIELVVTKSRIEPGAAITSDMLGTIAFHVDKVPKGAVRATNVSDLIGKYVRNPVHGGFPIADADITTTRPVSPLFIPEGFRAVSITADERAIVDGFAKPDSRVDVLWSYEKGGKKNIATILYFTRILSVAGSTTSDGRIVSSGNQPLTVTLLVKERDAKRLELARALGAISLVLVGDDDIQAPRQDPGTCSDIPCVLGESQPVQAKVLVARFSTVDPATGKRHEYCQWEGETNFSACGVKDTNPHAPKV